MRLANTAGVLLIATSVIASLWVDWFWIITATGALIVLTAGLRQWMDDDCGYDQTVYGAAEPEPEPPSNVIELRRHPEEYPFTKRGVMPLDGWSGE